MSRLGFDDFLVMGVVLALFFESPDDSLWLKHGFPIPNPTFVLVGAVVIGRAAFLAIRGRFDLSKPNWRELTVIGLFAVYAVTSLAAAATAGPHPQPQGSSVLISANGLHGYVLSGQVGRTRETRNTGSPGWTLRVFPLKTKTVVVGIGQGVGPVPASPEMSYRLSALVHSSGSPQQVALVLRQRGRGAAPRTVQAVRRITVSSRGWSRADLVVSGAFGASSIQPLLFVSGSARPAPVQIADIKLVGKPSRPFYLPSDRSSPYAASAIGAQLRQEANTGSPGWTVFVTPRALTPAVVNFPAEALSAPRPAKLKVVLTATSPVRLSLGLRQWVSGLHKPAAEKTVNVELDSSGWKIVNLRMARSPHANRLSAFFVVPKSAHPGIVSIARLQITGKPPAPPLALESHLAQSIKTFVHFAYLALIALLLGRLLTPALLRRAFVTFFVLAVAAAVVGCLQAIDQNVLHTGATGALHLLSRDTGNGFIRPNSIFSEPAVLGYYMLIGIILGLWLYGISRNRWIWLAMALCLVATLLGAAAGPVGALVPLTLYLMWRAAHVWRRYWRQLAILAVAAVAVLVFLPVGHTLIDRATGTGTVADNSAAFRQKFDRASVTIWELSPLTGVGLGNDRYYNPRLVHFGSRFSAGQQTEFQSVNSYLDTLSESGVFGLLMLTVMLAGLFIPFGRVRREGAWVTEAPILLFIVAFFLISLLVFPIFWFWVGARLAHLRHLEEPVESTQRQAARPEPMTA